MIFGASAFALTVMVRASTIIFFLSIPYSAAVSTMRLAIASLPSAVSGIPSSSRVRATTTPPYFLTSGKMLRITDSLPLTELTSALPL